MIHSLICTAPSFQVRAMVELLPEIDVIEDDAFNSSPTDLNLMGPDALQRYRDGESLPAFKAKTPLVRSKGPPCPSMVNRISASGWS